jgi:serine/threonine protein phosphatase 1
MQDPIRIKRHEANHRGRDFVVGDLHGCLALLWRRLRALRFDPVDDRLFSVGDLTDRGPDSPGCLRLLRAPWFYAVRGNHEEMLLGSAACLWGEVERALDLRLHRANGGDWVASVISDPDFPDLIRRIRDLPHVRVVGAGEDRVNIVHAEFPDGVTDADIDQGLPGVESAELLWSRRLMSPRHRAPRERPGLSPTYCGHTIGDIRERESHVCIDTGAFLTGELTVVELISHR